MGVFNSQGTITVVNSGGTSLVASLTPNSFVAFNNAGPGPGEFQATIWGTYTGTLAPFFSVDGINLEAVAAASISKYSTQATGAIAGNATGTYEANSPSGKIYMIATALSAGTPTVTMAFVEGGGGGSGGGSGGGGTVGTPSISGGQYNSSPITLTNLQSAPIQLDANGNTDVTNKTLAAGEDLPNNTQGVTQKFVIGTTYSQSFDVQGDVVSHTSKASAGQFFGFECANETATRVYFQVWNNGLGSGTLAYQKPVPGGSANSPGAASTDESFLGLNGVNCSVSIIWGLSSTKGTYTAIGSGTGITTTVSYA